MSESTNESRNAGDAAPAGGARAHRRAASVQFLCPRCEETFLFPIRGKVSAGIECPHCRLDMDRSPAGDRPPLSPASPVDDCWVCGNDELYVQKDFNRELGFVVVAGSAMVIFLVMLVIGHIVGILCLVALALADWLIYRKLADVTVCYLCQSIYRGFPANPRHGAFYLGSEEKYKRLRQEWLRETLKEAR